MSRIYAITNGSGTVERYVRANNLNAAIRAYAVEQFEAKPMTSDEVYQASRGAKFDVLDATHGGPDGG